MPTPKLYQYEVCPFCWKVRAALALKGVTYETIEVHPLNKKEIAFSDYKKVPIFVDREGVQVNDSTVIMKHVDKQYPGLKLFAAEGSEEDKLQNTWLEWSEAFVKAIPPLIYDTVPNALRAFDYITQEAKFSWIQRHLIKYSGALVMTMVAKKSREKQKIQNPHQTVGHMLSHWEEFLASKAFMGGAEPNAVDAAVFGISLSVKGLPAWSLFKEHAGFYAWMVRMSDKTRLPLHR